MLKAEKLSKTIQDKKILNELSFEILSGQIAIILGSSGAGKSTFLRVLNKLESHEGTFHSSGPVGMVFQQFNLFENLNTEDNIIHTLIHCKREKKGEAKKIAGDLLSRYGLADKAKLPISRLSGGQKQRLAIARTIAVDAKVICLDEPTSALDPRLTSQVAGSVKELAAEGRSVILTTHDMGLLDQLDGQVYLMENGMFVEQVLKSTYLSNPLAYPRLHQFLKG